MLVKLDDNIELIFFKVELKSSKFILKSLVSKFILTSLLFPKKQIAIIQYVILKYYIISLVTFIIFAIILSPIESYFLATSDGFIITILKLGLIFIIITLLTSLVLYAISNNAKNLFTRLFNLLKSKLKR